MKSSSNSDSNGILVKVCLFIAAIVTIGSFALYYGSDYSQTLPPRGKGDRSVPRLEERGALEYYQSRLGLLSEYEQLQREIFRANNGMEFVRRKLSGPNPPVMDSFVKKTKPPKPPVVTDKNGQVVSKYELSPKRQKPIPAGPDDTIFVSIASYRDLQCPHTVRDIYLQAFNPRRLYLGIIEQNDPSDPSCIPDDFLDEKCLGFPEKWDGFCPIDNIKLRRVRPWEARGPTFGRWVAGLMYQDQKWFMMIDSHNRFLYHWDSILIRMTSLTPNPERTVFSHYPNGWNENKTVQNEPEGGLMVMCYAHFLPLGYVRLGARVMSNSKKPRLCPYAAAGFLWADGSLVRNVPFDPYLDYIFDGEEVLYSVRMWTHGYDIYTPSQSVLYHFYYRVGAKRVYTDGDSKKGKAKDWPSIQAVSIDRARYLLQAVHNQTNNLMVTQDKIQANPRITQELDIYGLGSVRSLDDYYKFAELDKNKYASDHGFCDKLQAVKNP